MTSEIEPIAWTELLDYGAVRMRRASVKLTHVGEQTGPVPSLVIPSCYHLPRMDLFQPLRSAGISYENDELPEVLVFSVFPETLWEVLAAVGRSRCGTPVATSHASLSVMAYVELGEITRGGAELLSREEGVALHRALDSLISPTCPVGAAMLRRQRGSTYADAGSVPPGPEDED